MIGFRALHWAEYTVDDERVIRAWLAERAAGYPINYDLLRKLAAIDGRAF